VRNGRVDRHDELDVRPGCIAEACPTAMQLTVSGPGLFGGAAVGRNPLTDGCPTTTEPRAEQPGVMSRPTPCA
jgi:hypothetical protein